MCQACKYPREFKVGDRLHVCGSDIEIVKQYQETRNNEPDRKWYQVHILGLEHDPNRMIDWPCNTLCSVSPEGNQKIYAKPGICSGCGKRVRLYYPETMGMHGYWTCPECGMQYPFMFYDIKCDRGYDPEKLETTGVDQIKFKAE